MAVAGSFKATNSLEEREEQFRKVTAAHPGKIPVIVELAGGAGPEIPSIDKNKYLVPGDLTVAQFVCLIRKRIRLGNERALFIYVSGTLPASTALFSAIYAEYKDGFLYVVYTGESTFGDAVP